MIKRNLSLILSKKLKPFWQNIYNLNNTDECLIMGSSSSLNKVDLNSFREIPLITCNLNIFLDIFKSLNCILVNKCDPYRSTFNSRRYLKFIGLSNADIKFVLEVNKEIKNLNNIDFLLHFSAFPQYFKYKNVSFFVRDCFHGVNDRNIPLDLLLIETDSPFLSPTPMRGKQNEPSFIKYTAEYLADLLNLELEELISVTDNNFFKLFNKAKKDIHL